jgi:hypothetical protein
LYILNKWKRKKLNIIIWGLCTRIQNIHQNISCKKTLKPYRLINTMKWKWSVNEMLINTMKCNALCVHMLFQRLVNKHTCLISCKLWLAAVLGSHHLIIWRTLPYSKSGLFHVSHSGKFLLYKEVMLNNSKYTCKIESKDGKYELWS